MISNVRDNLIPLRYQSVHHSIPVIEFFNVIGFIGCRPIARVLMKIAHIEG